MGLLFGQSWFGSGDEAPFGSTVDGFLGWLLLSGSGLYLEGPELVETVLF